MVQLTKQILTQRFDALAGLLAAAVALAVVELMAAVTGDVSLIVAVGNVVVDYTPGPMVKWAIDLLGTKDKPVLLATIVLTSLLLGAGLGPAVRRWPVVSVVAFALFGIGGAVAGAIDPTASNLVFLSAALAAAAGWLAVRLLLDAATLEDRSSSPSPGVVIPGRGLANRRRFLAFSGAALGGTALATATGRVFIGPAVDVEAQRRAIVLPTLTPRPTAPAEATATAQPEVTATPQAEVIATAQPEATATPQAEVIATPQPEATATPQAEVIATPPPAEATAEATVAPTPAPPPPFVIPVEGQATVITPNETFYRIDTALVVPRIDIADWKLKVTGMVDEPYEIDFDELLSMASVQESVTLSCVSNIVGGRLVGNAIWLGVPLATVLDRAGVQQGATQIVGRSVDDFTTGFPTEVAYDGRAAMVALAMNGEPLPAEHGFPARLVIPGLYGYVSATKWLAEIELNTLEGFDAYWIPRGWSKLAPIKTQSRIDVPRRNLVAGRHPIAGVAWGGIRSIEKVEVRVTTRGEEPAPWQEAQLGERLSRSSWRQWVLAWDAEPGRYDIEVRATDGLGQTQTAEKAKAAPNGATGYHKVQLRVNEA